MEELFPCKEVPLQQAPSMKQFQNVASDADDILCDMLPVDLTTDVKHHDNDSSLTDIVYGSTDTNDHFKFTPGEVEEILSPDFL